VADGNYEAVRQLVWSRATDLIWLDYDRPVIMYRVIKRSLVRAVTRTELWAGNKEDWRNWLRPSHPITWAWTTWRQRRAHYEELLAREECRHLRVLRLRRPREAEGLVDALRGTV
jgi:CRP-like cAMP-binding protein